MDEIDAVTKENRMAGAVLLALGAAAAWSAADFGRVSVLSDASMALIEERTYGEGPAILPLTVALLASVVAGRPDMDLARKCARAARKGFPSALAAPLLIP